MRLSARTAIALLALACAAAWWLALRPRPTPPPPTPRIAAECPAWPDSAAGTGVWQSAPTRWLRLPAIADAHATPLASVALQARVLGRADYRHGREARYAPTDLALGWGRMTEDAVLTRLAITQSGRWYHYRWQGAPPLPPAEIVRNSANMHLIPATAEVAAALATVRPGQQVQLRGWLVQLDAPDGWRWRSSLTREDSGAGACELVFTCALQAR
ncbi:hypothetical protein [Thermomonas flagellata]|uniref:hypothetical protein n=1 Tax=Thermomonas flagellata TaxID=2888524 RepID=UPI001F04719A|nr:hypothetical protein [Thermomonas flagellata]